MILQRARVFILGLIAVLAPVCAFGGRVDDVSHRHLEAMGGKARIAGLFAMRANGLVAAAGKTMRFTLTAARPNRIRVETETGGRTLVQASDGIEPPWEFDTGEWPPRYRDMAKAAAGTFAADAEFDDPLVAGATRGYVLDDAGEVLVDGKKMHRLLVTRNLKETFSLIIDPDTYMIASRVEDRKTPMGRQLRVVTHYLDYRPVEGVPIPHRVVLLVDGQVKQQTQIESIQANPAVTGATFSRPRAVRFPGAKADWERGRTGPALPEVENLRR